MSPVGASALVAAGGALGALGRFWLATWLTGLHGTALPIATFSANASGSFLIGLVAALLGSNQAVVAFVMVGVLGGFTTFSTFSLETVRLLEAGRPLVALVYAGLSVLTCVGAAALGIAAGRAIA